MSRLLASRFCDAKSFASQSVLHKSLSNSDLSALLLDDRLAAVGPEVGVGPGDARLVGVGDHAVAEVAAEDVAAEDDRLRLQVVADVDRARAAVTVVVL